MHKIYENRYDSCVYLITYKGNKHPPYYIGSVYLDKFYNNYKGSTSSKKWKKIVQNEMVEHPELYKINVIQMCQNRELAFEIENKILLEFDARNNSLFWNMSNGGNDWMAISNNDTAGRKWYKTNDNSYKMEFPDNVEDDWKEEAPTKNTRLYVTLDGKVVRAHPKSAKSDWEEYSPNKNKKCFRKPNGDVVWTDKPEAGWEPEMTGKKMYKKPNGEFSWAFPKDVPKDWVIGFPKREQKLYKCDYCEMVSIKGNITRWHNNNCKNK